ncbi:MAG: CHAD domain-containing protein [Gemmatimonadaceae bacterium]
MDSNLPADALDRPAAETARRIALAHLRAARSAYEVLDDEQSPHALHDLRVALRRLRSCDRTFRGQLRDSITKKRRRRLRRVAQATGAGRDAQVHVAWIEEQLPSLSRRQRIGAAWILERLRASKDEHDARMHARLAGRFGPLADSLQHALSSWQLTVHLDEPIVPDGAARVLGIRLADLTGELESRLASVHDIADQVPAHRARIAAKHLRYALEPIAELSPDAAPLVERLRGLQDTVGDMHDAHLLAAFVADGMEDAAHDAGHRLAAMVREGTSLEGVRPAAPAGRDPRAGLLELARRLHQRSESLFAAFAGPWLGGSAAPFFDDARALAGRLAHHRAQGTEIERKFLLTDLPSVPLGDSAATTVQDIDQGYLPGGHVTERVRSIVAGGVTRWYRTVKGGNGLVRLELEDQIDRDLFDALWPLTSGRRVHKRRYLVRDGNIEWTIDEFLDRPLTLAEVELAHPDDAPQPPPWLAPHVDREVTGDPTYDNARLAR